MNPKARTCGDIIACATEQWGFNHTRCTFNAGLTGEYNCMFYNPRHPLGPTLGKNFHHPLNPDRVMRIEYPSRTGCATGTELAADWNMNVPFE